MATRFTVAAECGIPEQVQQEYFKASESDIEVNQLSPTGYPMRMLKNCPAIGSGIRPNCEAYGYILDSNGNCSYIDAYNRAKKQRGQIYLLPFPQAETNKSVPFPGPFPVNAEMLD